MGLKHAFFIFAPIAAAVVCLFNPILGVVLLGALWLAKEMRTP